MCIRDSFRSQAALFGSYLMYTRVYNMPVLAQRSGDMPSYEAYFYEIVYHALASSALKEAIWRLCEGYFIVAYFKLGVCLLVA